MRSAGARSLGGLYRRGPMVRSVAIRRRSLASLVAALLALVLLAGGPLAGRAGADDLELARVVQVHLERVQPKVQTLGKRLQRYVKTPTNRTRARSAGRAADAVHREVATMRSSISRTDASSAEGATLRRDLLRALRDVRDATGTIGSGLRRVGSRRANLATVRSLQRAQRQLDRGVRRAERVLNEIARAAGVG